MMYGRRDFFALDAMVEDCWFVEEVGIVVLIPTLKNGFFTQRLWPTGGLPAIFGLPAAAAAWAKWPGWKTILSVVVVCGGATIDAEERVRCSLYNTMVWLYVAANSDFRHYFSKNCGAGKYVKKIFSDGVSLAHFHFLLVLHPQ